jgi:hypothetical protein
MADEDVLRHRVTTILLSDATRKINFFVGPIHVEYGGFSAVFFALWSKSRGGDGIDIEIGDVPDGAAAVYDSDDDAYRFRNAAFGMTDAQRAVILHESVHAMRDIWGSTITTANGDVSTTYTLDEAAAYVAEALFRIYENTAGGTDTSEPLRVKADLVAQSIMNTPGAVVSDTDVSSLQDLVAANPVYRRRGISRSTSSGANGIKKSDPYFWSRHLSD